MLGEELETFEFDFEPFDVLLPTFSLEEFQDVWKPSTADKTQEPISENNTQSWV